MRSLNPIRLLLRMLRAFARRDATAAGNPPTIAPKLLPEPTVYADAPLTRLLMAIDRHASDLEPALGEYARARRAAGVQPEAVLVEFKRVLRRAIGMNPARPRLTGRLIELYFAG